MINFDRSFLTTWNGKIVYAPNGFGKTTCSNNIYKILSDNNENVEIFTRRNLENLVTTYKNKIFVGKTAQINKNNNILIDKYSDRKTSPLNKCLKDEFSITNAKKAKETSMFFKAINLSNTTNLIQLDEPVNKIISDYKDIPITITENDSKLIDKFYTYKLFEDIAFYCKKQNRVRSKWLKQPKYYISKQGYKILSALNEMVINSKQKYCPLCGKRFKDNTNLVNAINKQLNRYKIEEKQEILNNIKSILEAIEYIAIQNNIVLIKELFLGINKELVSDLYLTLHNVYNIFCQSILITFNTIKRYCYNTSKIGDDLLLYQTNLQKISYEEIKIKKNNELSIKIKKLFEDIAYLPSNVQLKHDDNYLTFKLIINGEEKDNIYNYLSESEIKRLSLSILKVLVDCKTIDYLILDDPIDSYDDYYVTLACNAIKDIVKTNKLKGWYITTNNFNLLFYFSEYNYKFKIYNENPDIVFNGALNDMPIEIDVSSKEINSLNSNELSMIKDLVRGVERKQKTVPLDRDLSFLTFAVTLRNFKDLVIDGYGKIRIKKYNNSKFKDDVTKIIEHCYMHYDFIPNSQGKTSLNITNNDLFDIYNKIFEIYPGNDINYFQNNNSSLTNFRETVAKKSWSERTGSKIIALVFSKIVMMSYLKYHIEEIIIDKLRTLGFNDNQLSKITNCNNGLKEKLKVIKKINNNLKITNVTKFYDKLNSLHQKFHSLFNSFDHALDLLFPPYLATSMLDIKRLKDEIEKL